MEEIVTKLRPDVSAMDLAEDTHLSSVILHTRATALHRVTTLHTWYFFEHHFYFRAQLVGSLIPSCLVDKLLLL